jgi:hypothetical protein
MNLIESNKLSFAQAPLGSTDGSRFEEQSA